MLCKVPVHSFKVNYNIVRSIKDYIENRTTLKLAEILERIWRLHIFNQKGEASASSFFALILGKMRISVVNAYTELCNDSIEKFFEIQEVSLC